MKKLIIFALALALTGGAAYATWCARDFVPAATLLVPYIVVDMNADGTPNTAGYTTLTIVTNVSSAKQLIHVTVFNALSVGVVDFDEVLSGYDVWSINWRDLLTGRFDLFDTGYGSLASASSNPSFTATLFGGAATPAGFWAGTTGTIPAQFGPTTNPGGAGLPALNNPQDVDFAAPPNTNCGFSWGNLSTFSSLIVSGLQSPLKAYATQDTDCVYSTTADDITPNVWLKTLTNNPLFFYATIDVVNACNGFFPDRDGGYWLAGGYATDNNVIIGDDFYLNNTLNYSESTPAVSIEADTDWKSPTHVGFYTKQRYAATNPILAGADQMDDHEPLGNAFAFNYITQSPITTSVVVWKNRHDIDTVHNYVLACRPYIYYAWDENEKGLSRTTTTCPSGLCFGNPEPNVFPLETQMVAVTTSNFSGLPAANGWMLIVFDPAIPYLGSFASWLPATEPNYRAIQAYVFAKYNWAGYSTSIESAQLANTFCWTGQTLATGLNTYIGNSSNPPGGFCYDVVSFGCTD
jgi:hypothetical protein